MPEEEIRWHYRFLLNELEQEGVIQRFKYTFELAWNTLKDRLEHDGMVLSPGRTSTWLPVGSWTGTGSGASPSISTRPPFLRNAVCRRTSRFTMPH